MYLPLHAALRAWNCGGAERCRGQRVQIRGEGAREGVERQDRRIRRRLGGRWSDLRVERLKDDVGRRDQRYAGDLEGVRGSARPHGDRDQVADPRLERGGELLVEHDLPGLELTME